MPGQNVAEVQEGRVRQEAAGEFAPQPQVRQRWAELPVDTRQRGYQAGVFWAGAGCALGFRRDKALITNLSEFVPHVLE